MEVSPAISPGNFPAITQVSNSISRILEFSAGNSWIQYGPWLLIAWGAWSERRNIYRRLRDIDWRKQWRRFRQAITVHNLCLAGLIVGAVALPITLMELLEWRYGAGGTLAMLLCLVGSLIWTLKPRSSARAQRLARLAAAIAGSRRSHLRDEWTAVLASGADPDVSLPPAEQQRLARGFVLAALKMRLHDLVAPLWYPVDWLLSKDSRTNGFIAAVVGAQAIYIVDDDGISALVTEIWEPCGILGAGLYVLARWLRRVRGIELATTSPPPEE
jgi:hypothetical protein